MRRMPVLLLLFACAAVLLAEAIDWNQTTQLPRASWRHACAASGGWVYFLGGGEGPVANCDFAQVNPDGTLGQWVATTPLPAALGWFSADATEGHIYVCGGWNLGGLTGAVWYAELDSSGGIGAWRQGTRLPTALYTQGALLVDSCLYVLGGATGVGAPTIASVRYARIAPDGSIGSWTETSALPQPLRIMGAAVKDTWLYSVGGRNEGGSAVNSVCFARIKPDGSLSPWTPTTPMPQPGDGLTCVVVGDRIYAVGGWGAGALSSVYSAQVNPDGSLGPWTTETSLPAQRWASDGVSVNGRIYVPGGYVSSPQAEVFYSSALTGAEEEPCATCPLPLAVWPNPVRSGRTRVRVSAPDHLATGSLDHFHLSLLDASGRVVHHSSFFARSSPFPLDLHTVPPGVYVLRLTSGGHAATRKLIVQ
ncbi:T9SS type A sorting domain-containing protein [candidate division WOR-3 bacterium]|nr:T9SS type A sorting domain-containing protein [candidate division WOR-3 bacterium]